MNVGQLRIDIGQYSIAGAKPRNDDSYGVLVPQGHLLESKGIAAAIADGVSSSLAAKQASELAVRGFLDDYTSTPETWSVKQSVSTLLKSSNDWLYAQGEKMQGEGLGLATTFSGLVLRQGTAHVFHLGDTRIWLLRKSRLTQLTTDHRKKFGRGQEQLVRGLGLDSKFEMESQQLAFERNDLFILTSDGVHDHLSTQRMAEICGSQVPLHDIAKSMVDAAFENGSQDNLTCQIIRVEEVGSVDVAGYKAQAVNLPFPPLLKAGQKLDGYEILRLLSESSRSQVYLAKATGGNVVAIKTPSPNFEDDSAYINGFAREEWIGRTVQSPHLVKSLEATEQPTALYHVMEYFEGQPLDQWMKDNGKPDLQKVRAIIGQAALGLRALHRKGVLHLDLKPGNVLIDAAGTVKLIDYGSAQTANLDEESRSAVPLHGGTKDYSAPELLNGARATNLVDIYSLAAITYEMLTGRLPFGRGFAKPRDLNTLDYLPARFVNNNVPLWVDAALEKALHKKPAERTETLSGFIANIETPNPSLGYDNFKPLLERNPIRFWQFVSFVLALTVLILMFNLNK